MSSTNVFMQWLVSWLDNWARHSGIRNIIKLILRQLTGKCELQRICDQKSTDARTMRLVENCLYLSKFPELRRILVADDMKIKTAFENILITKRILSSENPVFTEMMPVLLAKILSYNKLAANVEKIRSIPYDEKDEEHEILLLKLWNSLKPDDCLNGRYTLQWGEIGFQGKNPATDFRGMGILSLRNLIFFIDKQPDEVKRMFSLSLHPRFGYPFSVAGINLTGVAFDLLRSGKLKSYFYATDETSYNIEHFQDVFIRLFNGFTTYYISSEPENIMEFNQLLGKYKEIISSRLEKNDLKFDDNIFTI
eukprot:gene14373-15874_t